MTAKVTPPSGRWWVVVFSSVAKGNSGSAASRTASVSAVLNLLVLAADASAAESGAITSGAPRHTHGECLPGQTRLEAQRSRQCGQRRGHQPRQEAGSARHVGRSSKRTRDAAAGGT